MCLDILIRVHIMSGASAGTFCFSGTRNRPAPFPYRARPIMVSSYRPLTLCCLASLSLTAAANTGHAAEPPKKEPSAETRSTASARASGREIFLREWIPNDPRSHGGDGLGPVFNESSCVSCHNQGGVGGGGSGCLGDAWLRPDGGFASAPEALRRTLR